MPRFYFDIIQNRSQHWDTEGIAFSSAEAAAQSAMAALAEMMRDCLRNSNSRLHGPSLWCYSLHMRDQEGRTVMRGRITSYAEWLEDARS